MNANIIALNAPFDTRTNDPPPVANLSVNESLNNAWNGHGPDGLTRAGKATKRLKASNELNNFDLLTAPEECGSQMIYTTKSVMEGMDDNVALPPGAPAWSIPMNADIVARLVYVDAWFTKSTSTVL